ncbi:zinc finger protein 710-like [Periophthalmus magnuspinnatus]|uniref:zinc finger protein 710-like n=1 Tax=Periophthalmus magnuspinnatus TaxID=409849 RepID=UPI00145B2765|nr:zinc finger protein 710-like [Periophthalmus magnuspinnatus]
MRSVKQLAHDPGSTVEERGCPIQVMYPKKTLCLMEVGTQTEPVVVLSLAQAAVLGLISQNEIFRGTIAPNGFYNGEPKDCAPPPQEEGMDYEYADQLIGANGDYLQDPARDTEAQCKERRRPLQRDLRLDCPHKTPSPAAHIKGERLDCDSHPSCTLNRHGELDRHQASPKEELVSVIHTTSPQDGASVEEVEPERQEEALNLKISGDNDSSQEKSYYESSEPTYESSEEPPQAEYEGTAQAMLWSDPEGLARRMQIDRLDINVQIDESYCVDVGEGLKRWKCRMCEKSYTSKYNLVTHILGHSGIKPHECVHCGKLFKQPSHLQTHLLTHQGTRPHKCTVCEKAFTQTSHLKRHMLQHSDIKPYACRFCGRGFAYPSELRTHENKHESGQCHVCAQCGLEFPSYAHLKRHQASHQGPTSYQCSECNKCFSYRSQLQNHILKHQNVRPYVCPECGMEFVQIHHLRQHALTHKGMKEFKCDVCSREFTLSANLKRHMLIHASVRPFQCHICFKTFVQKQTLKTHMIVHLPVKPFKCKVCGKSFNRMYNLLGHMHLHAGNKPFKCPYCTSKFNLKGNLSRHMKVKHGILDASIDGPEPPQDADSQEDYEENFDYSERENRGSINNSSNNSSNNTAEMNKLSSMAYYGTYGKNTGRYSHPEMIKTNP